MDVSQDARGRSVVTAVVMIMAITAVGIALLVWARDALPSRIVTHWGPTGEPDGWMDFTGTVCAAGAISVLIPLTLLALGAAMGQHRAMAIVAVATSAFVMSVVVASTLQQRHGGDASDPGPALFIGSAIAAVLGLVTWLLVRRRGPLPLADRSRPLPEGAPHLEVGEQARLMWSGRTRGSTGALWFGVVSMLVLLVMPIMLAVMHQWWAALFLSLLAVGVGVLLTTLRCRVTIDHRGLQARGLGLIPWTRVPLEAIESATSAAVNGLGDYGGYGLRGGFDGSWGLITSSGAAMRIERAGMKPFVVTLDDVDGAVATLNTLIEQRRPR